jgi:hypothetical protein
MPTVTVTAVFTPIRGHKNALVEALAGAIPAVHNEQGCLLYAIHDTQDGTITMIEAIAVETGAVMRAGRVEDGTCISDYDDIEQRQHSQLPGGSSGTTFCATSVKNWHASPAFSMLR